MPTYTQTWTWYEDGFGTVTEMVVVSDTYDGLRDLASAVEVGVFTIESTKHDLDIEAGVFATDEMGFGLSEVVIETQADRDAVDFVLAARANEIRRFIGRVINPSDPIAIEDFDFIGVVQKPMSGDDKRWSGNEFDTTATPVREWSCTAYSFDAQAVLAGKVKDVVAAIPQSWHDSNVSDRLGYFYLNVSGLGAYEARYCNLVSLESLLQELLTQSVANLDSTLPTPSGLVVTYEATDTDIWVRPAHWQVYRGRNGHYTRYSAHADGNGNPMPYKVILSSNFFRLKVGGAPTSNESIYVSSRLISPRSDEESYSWLRYDTVADLVYALASNVGGYVEFVYDDSTHIRVRISPRSTIDRGPVYLRDATSGKIDVKPKSSSDNNKKSRFIGASWQTSGEGETQYNYDGGFHPGGRERDNVPTGGELLPLTISPTYCFLENRGEDFSVDMADEAPYGISCIPHNVAFWDRGTRKSPAVAEYNTEALHTGMYMRLDGRSDDGSYGCSGHTVFLPLGWMQGTVGGEMVSTDRMSDYLNKLYQRDDTYYEGEYEIDVPYICSFRSSPTGPMDWRHLTVGTTTTLDSVQWTVIGIERKSLPAPSTSLRLHAASRYPIVITPAADTTELSGGLGRVAPSSLPRVMAFKQYVAGESIKADDVVICSSIDGRLYRAQAHHKHYGAVVGIATTDAQAEDSIVVQCSGRYTLQGATVLTPGARIYLRTSEHPDPNFSQEPLLWKNDVEDTFLDFGVAETSSTIVIELSARHYVFYPPIPDPL